jgi:hypothetical protein
MNGFELFEKLASEETTTKYIKSLKSQIKTSITVIGRKWRDEINGNTYHTVEVWHNGVLLKPVAETYQYGYGNQFEFTAMAILVEKGICKGSVPYLSWLPKEKFIVVISVTQVMRKKDLFG